MRLLPVLAAVAASLGLAACTLNTAPPASPPPSATIVTPPAQPMMMAPAPASPSVIVR